MKDLLAVLLFIMAVLSSCNAGGEQKTSHVADFEESQTTRQITEECIERYLEGYSEIHASAVSLSNNIAVIGLDLAGEYDDTQVVVIKQKIVDEIKQFAPEINHVAVTTCPDLYTKILGPCCDNDHAPKTQTPNKTPHNEIFDIPVPTI